MQHWRFRSGARRWRLVARALIVSALVAAGAVLAVSAEAGTAAPRLASVQRAPQTPVGADALGAPAASSNQTGYVVLKPRDEQALQSFIASVDKPHSSLYHHYLRVGQFDSRFGPSSATVAAVRSQLNVDGLSVTSVARDGLLIGFSGTTSAVESAFGTSLERYRSAAGITGEQTTKAISLPTTISSDVAAVVGLNTLVHPEAAVLHPPASAYADHAAAKTASFTHYTGAPNPCSAATSDAAEFGGLTDDQIANAYGATSLYGSGDTGAGVSIGVYELEPYASGDLKTFDDCYFGTTQGNAMASSVAAHVVPVDGGLPTGPGSGESILDIEDVSAMAPGAQINVYEAPNDSAGSLDEYDRMVDDDTDQIITSSWGLCEQDLQLADPGAQQAENYIFEQAAAQGQTVLSAAGDTGDDSCNEVRDVPPPNDQNPLSVGDPASQPYVLGVGGTTIDDADPANYTETVWNDGAQWGGGGGGISESWEAPSWQQSLSYYSGSGYSTDLANANHVESQAAGKGISQQNLTPGFCAVNTTAGFTSSTPCRGVPDVAAEADEFTGAVTIYQANAGGWSTIGGTSSATPIWAALLALVDRSTTCSNNAITNIGFASPLLYAVAANGSEYSESFHDIGAGPGAGNNDTYGFDNGAVFPALPGYDLATGLGSPILAGSGGTPGLAQNLCNLAAGVTTTPTVTNLSPAVGSKAGGSAVTVTGSGFGSAASPQVKFVTIGSDVIPRAHLSVISNTQLTITTPAGSASLAPGAASNQDLNTGTTYPTGGSYTGQDGAGLANVIVTLNNGISSAVYSNGGPFKDQYAYVDETSNNTTPSVSSVSPYAAAQAGGSTLTVYGSGFAPNDTVTIGAVSASTVTYVSPWELHVVTPAYSSSNTTCATQSELVTELTAIQTTPDTNPAGDNICQTQVVVTEPTGPYSSGGALPLPTYLGALPETNEDGLLEVPNINGVQYELSPVPDEFDYVPSPTIASTRPVSTVDHRADADPAGYGVATELALTGTGLNYQTLSWLSFGDPTQASGEATNLPSYADGTHLTVTAPADPNGTPTAGSDPDVVPVTADTMGGQSMYDSDCAHPSVDCVTYAGLPEITSVTSAQDGTSPDTGGTNVTIDGAGLTDVVAPIEFVDSTPPPTGVPPVSIGTQYYVNPSSTDTELETQTVSQNPASVITYVCSDSGCWPGTAAQAQAEDTLLLYPPGNPVITSLQDASGPALGGTLVTINGENLGCVTSVSFGSTVVEAFSNTEALLDCGSTSQLTVVAPPGSAGDSVPITVTTLESDALGHNGATSPSDFTYDTVNPSVTSSVSFGAVNLASSSSQTVTISNPATATQPLYPGPATGSSADPAALGGSDAGDFSITNDGCSEQTLNPGQSCTIQVRFAPTALGSRDATLDIPWNNSISVSAGSDTPDFTVGLSGTGAEPTNTVTTAGATTSTTITNTVTKTVAKTVTCTITVTHRWVTVKVHGKKRREYKKVTTRSKGCPKAAAKKAAKPKKKHEKPSRKHARPRRRAL